MTFNLFRSPLFFASAAVIGLGLTATLALGARATSPTPPPRPAAAGPKLAHMVFFTLKDHSKASREGFVASCQKYLDGHQGTAYFSVGTIAEDVEEPVSVRDFDVALHLVFDTKEDEAKYIKDPRHVAFVDENKASFAKVRVFDTYLAARP
jgi:hypothetical protein